MDLEGEKINDEARRLVDGCKDLCASLVEVHSDETIEFIHGTVKR